MGFGFVIGNTGLHCPRRVYRSCVGFFLFFFQSYFSNGWLRACHGYGRGYLHTAYECQFFANLQFANESYQGFVDIIVHGGYSRAYLILQPTYRSWTKSLPRNVGFYDWRFSMWRAMAPTKHSFLPVHVGIPSLQPRKP